MDILKVKRRTLEAGYDWEVYNETMAQQTAKKANITYEELVG